MPYFLLREMPEKILLSQCLLSYSFCIIGQFYLNGTIKIRGGSSCFERQLRYSSCCIPLLCPEQSGSLILCHAHTHCEKIRFSTPKRLWPGPFFLTISAGLQQQVEGQLLLLSTGLDSFSKIWSPQLRRKERKMCFGDKQRNFHSQLLSIESLLSLREMTPLCSLHLATEWQFPRVW